MSSRRASPPPLASAAASCGACIAANIVTHPLETIKTRQQLPGAVSESFMRVARQVAKTEGVAALYKGVTAAAARAVVSGGGRLEAYSFLKRHALRAGVISAGAPAREMPVLGVMAVSAGCFAAFLGSPLDLIRTRQAAFQGPYEQCPSMVRIGANIVRREGGPRGLFAGSMALMGRAASFNLGQLVSYDLAKARVVRSTGLVETDSAAHVASSMCAGLVATCMSCPFENVKTEMQLTSNRKRGGSGGGSSVMTMPRLIHSMYRLGGVGHFFRGFAPLYLKIAPHTLIVFVVAERLRTLFGVHTF